jgi:hypothetical protein
MFVFIMLMHYIFRVKTRVHYRKGLLHPKRKKLLAGVEHGDDIRYVSRLPGVCDRPACVKAILGECGRKF